MGALAKVNKLTVTGRKNGNLLIRYSFDQLNLICLVLLLKKPDRIVFYEITKEAITEAMARPRQIDDHLRLAQEARRC